MKTKMDYCDELEEYQQWECYLCGKEDEFENMPAGYLANYHPLCRQCANAVWDNDYRSERHRLTYHQDVGDIDSKSGVRNCAISVMDVKNNFFIHIQ